MVFGLHHCNFYQNVISWVHPFHRRRITMFRRTNDAHRTVPTRGANHVNFPASDHFPTNEAITFLIQGVPMPELVESSQHLQLFVIG